MEPPPGSVPKKDSLIACLKQELDLLEYWDKHYSSNLQLQEQLDARAIRAKRHAELTEQIAELERKP